METCITVALFVAYFGAIIVFALIRKSAAERTIRIIRTEDWNNYCGKEWRELSIWLRDHPYGAITGEEYEERNNLVYYLQGSYFLYCQSKGIDSFTDPYALWLDEQIQDRSIP